MIPWESLRPFWNRQVTTKHHDQLLRYLEIIGFPGNGRHLAAEVLAGRINELRQRALK